MFGRQSNRRQALRRGLVLLWGLLLVMALAGCATHEASMVTPPLGDYTTALQADLQRLGDVSLVSAPTPGTTWTLSLGAGNRYSLAVDGATVVDGHFRWTDDAIVLADELGPLACTGRLEGAYGWKLQGMTLGLTARQDDCAQRKALLDGVTWSAEPAQPQRAALPAAN